MYITLQVTRKIYVPSQAVSRIKYSNLSSLTRFQITKITQQISYLSEDEGDKLLGLPVAGMDDMGESREGE